MSNWKAGLIHFCISVPVVVIAALTMVVVWFPPPLFQAAGGQHLILILAGVDVVIGPLLTLLVYQQGKRTLKFDLAVIGIIQVGALLYGVHTIFLARPAYIVFAVNQFEVVTAADIPAEEQLKAHLPEFRHSPAGRFRVVAARLPESIEEQQRILFASLVGHDLPHFPQHYISYDRAMKQIAARAAPVAELKKLNPGREQQIERWIERNGRSTETVRFLPVRAVKRDFTALIDAQSGQLLDFALFTPW